MADVDMLDLGVATILLGGLIYLIINYCFKTSTSHNIQVAAPSASSAAEDDFVAKMEEVGAQLIVFYGSQTGTAEDYAQRLAGEARRYGLKAIVADFQDYDMDQLEQLKDAVALFCVATYGEGEPTDNAQDFYENVKNKTDTDMDWDLKGLDFGVFGLGNKTYEHFNAMATFMDQGFEKFGGNRIIEVCLDSKHVETRTDLSGIGWHG
jgi:NADPH-ferrihemoprotein reductase